MKAVTARFDGGSVAQYYHYRIPYHPAFFRSIATTVELVETSKPLDLCCGQGEIAKLLCSYAQRILAVDVSNEMLRRGHSDPRIRYINADVNAEEFTSRFEGESFTHCFIGRAIHWIDQDSLNRMTQSIFRDAMWLVTMQAGFSRKTPWLKELRQVKSRHGDMDEARDHISKEKVLNAGFDHKESKSMEFEVEVTFDYLLGNALSYSGFKVQRQADLKSDMLQSLAPWVNEKGTLQAVVSQSALIYRLEG